MDEIYIMPDSNCLWQLQHAGLCGAVCHLYPAGGAGAHATVGAVAELDDLPLHHVPHLVCCQQLPVVSVQAELQPR